MIRGVTQTTFQKLQLGEGAFLKSEYTGTESKAEFEAKVLSATRGGATITITPVFRTRSVDGVPANTAEARTIDSVTAVASFVALEITPELLRRACAGNYDESTKILTLKHTLTTTDFGDLYWVGETSKGSKVQIAFKSAINTNGITLRTQPNNEGELSMNFEANYTVADLDTPPVEIRFIEE